MALPAIGNIYELTTLHFSASGSPSARSVSMAALSPPTGGKFPLPSTVLQYHPNIPIRTSLVSVQYGDRTLDFSVFYRFHSVFLRNRALRALKSDLVWTGDMVVVKRGFRDDFVNLKPGLDRRVAERAVCAFLEQSAPHIVNAARAGTPILFPDEISVDFI